MRLFLRKIVIYVGFIALFASCSHKQPKIGFLFPNFIQKRYLKEREYFTKRVAELGGTTIILSADNNDNNQIQQAKDIVEQGIDVLVVDAVNANTAAAIVRIAHARDIPVIAYDRLIRNCDLDYFLSFDNEKVGQLMADYALNAVPSGKYILLGGDKSDQNAIWVKNGQLKELEPSIKSNKIQIVYNTFIENWSGDNAQFEIRKYLDLSMDKPDVILSSYDGMTTSVIELLKEYKLNAKIVITGQDAEIEACRNIINGNQAMTVYKSLKALANKAAELSVDIAERKQMNTETVKINNGQTDVVSVILPPVLVDKSNIKSVIIGDGLYSESELNE